MQGRGFNLWLKAQKSLCGNWGRETYTDTAVYVTVCLVQTKVKSWELLHLNNLGVWKADASGSYDLVSVNR